jgi:hypothetical protein
MVVWLNCWMVELLDGKMVKTQNNITIQQFNHFKNLFIHHCFLIFKIHELRCSILALICIIFYLTVVSEINSFLLHIRVPWPISAVVSLP